MKTTEIKLNKKALIKAGCAMLSFVLTANAGLSLFGKNVFAADPAVTVAGNTVSCVSNIDTYGFVSFDLEYDNGYTLSYYSRGKHPTQISNNLNFSIGVYSEVSVYNDYTFGNVAIMGYGGGEIGTGLYIERGAEATMNGIISGNGGNSVINNKGTMKFNELVITSLSGITAFKNNGGTIKADKVTINGDIYTDTSSAKIIVTDSFNKNSNDINAVVYAEEDTAIYSTGGTFTLNVNGAQKTITGSVGTTAGELMDDSNASLDALPDVYFGQSYDFSSYMHTATGYTGDAYLEYSSSNGGTWSATKPTATGGYYVRAVAPVDGSYLASTSSLRTFRIGYLPNSSVSSTGNYYTFENVTDGKYVDGQVKVVPASGYKIACSHASDPGFADYLMISEDDILVDGSLNEDAYFTFKRISDGAETDAIYASSIASPSFEDLVFDTDTPAVYEVMLDTSEGMVETYLDSSENDTRVIFANSVTFNVYDETLKTVEMDGQTYTEGNGITDGSFTATVESTVATTRNVEFTATDALGKSTTIKFKLLHEPVDPSINVTLPDPIYVGTEYAPEITTNSDGVISVKYSNTDGSGETETPFTSAGTYKLTVDITATDYYNSTHYETEYTVVKRPAEATVSVEDIYIGGTVTPVVTTESDGKDDAAFEYKNSSDPDTSYSPEVPTAAGTYNVRATIPETDTYLALTCTGTFTIRKLVVTASVSVENITVGGTLKPVITTESDAKADTTFEYKLISDPDSAYSTKEPTAAGIYSVRATVPESDVYAGITCYGEFTISLNEVKFMELTIKDFYVGQEIDINYRSESDGKMTVMYKPSDAPDTAYTSEVPSKPGKYTARASVPETDIYFASSCTTEFTISYLEAPKTAFIPEGTEGNNGYFTSDVILTAPKGYKISTSLDGIYSESIPYSEDLAQIYLRRDDGALTAAITLNNRPKIDKNAPALTSSKGDLSNKPVIYVSDMKVVVEDKNLKSLVVNGDVIDLNSGSANNLVLSPGYGTVDYRIVAEDEAGNITVIEFTLKAEWLENKIILPDVVLPLSSSESYNLDEGTWTVTLNDSEGNPVEDTTVYNGNMPVYVNADGDYTFTQVT